MVPLESLENVPRRKTRYGSAFTGPGCLMNKQMAWHLLDNLIEPDQIERVLRKGRFRVSSGFSEPLSQKHSHGPDNRRDAF